MKARWKIAGINFDHFHMGDLLRNYLFMRLPTRGEQVYESTWLPLQESLTSDELELLFWLDLVQQDPAHRQADTYAAQQQRLENEASHGNLPRRGCAEMADLRIGLYSTNECDECGRRGGPVCPPSDGRPHRVAPTRD